MDPNPPSTLSARVARKHAADSDGKPSRLRRWLAHPALAWVLTALAVLLAAPALFSGLQADDYFHRAWLRPFPEFPELTGPKWDLFAFSYGDPERVQRLMDLGIAPWWTLPELKMAFCRPLSALAHALDYWLWPDNPALMHAHNLVWFAAFIAGACLCYRRILGPGMAAGLAMLLFALDDAHATPAGWIAGRNTLIAAALGMWCLAAHDRWRRDGWRPGAAVAPLLLVVSLLSAEAGVATLAYIVPHALFLDRAPWRRRLLALTPYFVAIVLWRIAWVARGYGVQGVESYVDPITAPLKFVWSVLEVGPILLLGQWALPPSDLYALYDVFLSGLSRWVWLAGTLFLVLAAAIVLPRVRGARTAAFWASGMMLALLPICATAGFPMDRLLLFVGLGAFGLLAQFLDAVWPSPAAGAVSLPGACSRPARVLATVFVGIHLLLAPLAFVARAAAPAGPEALTRQFYIELPADAAISGRDVVVVNAPSGTLVGMLPVERAAHGQSIPRRTRMLGPSLSAVTVTRENAHSLRVLAEDAYLFWSYDRLVRSLEYPFAAGQRIELAGMTVEILATTTDGRPSEARFDFDVPLEDPSLAWLQWREGKFGPFTPPAVGASIYLPRAAPKIEWLRLFDSWGKANQRTANR